MRVGGLSGMGIVLFMLSYSVFIMCVCRSYVQGISTNNSTQGWMAIHQYLLHLQTSICTSTFQTLPLVEKVICNSKKIDEITGNFLKIMRMMSNSLSVEVFKMFRKI